MRSSADDKSGELINHGSAPLFGSGTSHVTVFRKVSIFTKFAKHCNALLGCSRRIGTPPPLRPYYPLSLSLFSRVLLAYIGIPIHLTPYFCLLFLPPTPHPSWPRFLHILRILLRVPNTIVLPPPRSSRPTVFINGWSGTPNEPSAADGSCGIIEMNGDRVPLSWICGSAVWILYSSSFLTLPSLLARIFPLCASLGFFPPCFPRNLLSLSGRSLPVPIPFQLQRPFLLPFYATWPSLPPFPVASPPFTHQNPGSSAFFRRLSIYLPSQLEAQHLCCLFLPFQGVGTEWRECPSLSPVLTTLIAVASSSISCLSWHHTRSVTSRLFVSTPARALFVFFRVILLPPPMLRVDVIIELLLEVYITPLDE